MKMLDDYFRLENEVYAYFGHYGWRYQIVDARQYYWRLSQDDANKVYYAENINDLGGDKQQYNVCDVKTGQHHVYRGDAYTMVRVSYGYKDNVIKIFANSKERAMSYAETLN